MTLNLSIKKSSHHLNKNTIFFLQLAAPSLAIGLRSIHPIVPTEKAPQHYPDLGSASDQLLQNEIKSTVNQSEAPCKSG